MSEVNWEEVESAVRVLRDAAADIDYSLGKGNPGDVDLAAVARVIMPMVESLNIMRHAFDAVHAVADSLMEDNEHDIPGLARFERKWSRKRSNWDHETLRRDALHALKISTEPHAVDPTTGERVYTWDQCLVALNALYNLAGYNARVTKLQQLGLDPGDYSTQGPWTSTITVEPLTPEEDDADTTNG